jgi:hypothetical protein
MMSNSASHTFLHTERKGNFQMATSKTFKIVGVSTFKGKRKVRYAQDMTRVKALIKAGNTDVELFELPEAMTKEQARAYVVANSLFAMPADADEATAEDVLSAAQ